MRVTINTTEGNQFEYTGGITKRGGKRYISVSGDFPPKQREYEVLTDGCPKCSHPDTSNGDYCFTCDTWDNLEKVVSLGVYYKKEGAYYEKSPLSQDIIAAKRTSSNPQLYGYGLGFALAIFVKENNPELLKSDTVVPMPWYNPLAVSIYHHAQSIAKTFCDVLKMDFRDDILNQIGPMHMVGKKVHERYAQAKENIHATEVEVDNEVVLIIDDVLTSSASMERCADELVRIGAKSVCGLVVGRSCGR